jgi:hypothetical protein
LLTRWNRSCPPAWASALFRYLPLGTRLRLSLAVGRNAGTFNALHGIRDELEYATAGGEPPKDKLDTLFDRTQPKTDISARHSGSSAKFSLLASRRRLGSEWPVLRTARSASPCGGNPSRPCARNAGRSLVPGRDAGPPEKQAHLSLGQKGIAASGRSRSTHPINLPVRCRVP